MLVNIFFEETEILDFDPEFFALWYQEIVGAHDKELGDVCLVFCSDEYLLNVNKKHLNHDYYTDIVTFNYNDGRVVSGDLFISVDRVKDNAITLDVAFKEELLRVCAHGLLHLIGYNDKSESEAKEMRVQENKALSFVSRET